MSCIIYYLHYACSVKDEKTEKSVMHVHHTLTLRIVYFDVLVAVASLDQARATKGMINLG